MSRLEARPPEGFSHKIDAGPEEIIQGLREHYTKLVITEFEKNLEKVPGVFAEISSGFSEWSRDVEEAKQKDAQSDVVKAEEVRLLAAKMKLHMIGEKKFKLSVLERARNFSTSEAVRDYAFAVRKVRPLMKGEKVFWGLFLETDEERTWCMETDGSICIWDADGDPGPEDTEGISRSIDIGSHGAKRIITSEEGHFFDHYYSVAVAEEFNQHLQELMSQNPEYRRLKDLVENDGNEGAT